MAKSQRPSATPKASRAPAPTPAHPSVEHQQMVRDADAILDPEDPVEADAKATMALVVADDGGRIAAFIGGMEAFFRGAAQIEVDAKATLAKMQARKRADGTWTLPTSKEEDAALQDEVRAINKQKSGALGYWESLTKAVHAVRSRLTTKRSIAEDALVEAAAIGNKIHKAYGDAEDARVRQENARLQQEEEDRARAARQKELDDKESAALAAEDAMPDLSAREQVFVTQMVPATASAEQAAKAAGFPNALASAARLMKAAKIIEAIRLAKEADSLRRQATAAAAKPLPMREVEEVKPQTSTKGDTTTWSGECFDLALARAAWKSGQYGIPDELWVIDQVALNREARGLMRNLNRWPGFKANDKTGVR